jgi:hypothetical protein
MADAITEVNGLSDSLSQLASTFENKRLRLASPKRTQPIVRPMAQSYFEFVRPELEATDCRPDLIADLDRLVQVLIDLSTMVRDKQYYMRPMEESRALLLEATVHLMKARGVPRLLVSVTERAILRTLSEMLPASGKSYEQVLRDLTGSRISWRGTAAELREVLREVMDHLAPDQQVKDAPGFQFEGEQTKPTQRQKVRFILKARRAGSSAIDNVEETLETVDAAIASLARTTYTRGAASTHTAPVSQEIRNLKRYTDAVLAELLVIV